MKSPFGEREGWRWRGKMVGANPVQGRLARLLPSGDSDKPALDRRIPNDDISVRRSFTYQMFLCYFGEPGMALDGSKHPDVGKRGRDPRFYP